MRLIDADKFIETNKDIIDCSIGHSKYEDTLRELIDNAPTVTIKEWKEEMPIYIKDAMLEALRPQEEKEHKERIFNPFDHRTIGEI